MSDIKEGHPVLGLADALPQCQTARCIRKAAHYPGHGMLGCDKLQDENSSSRLRLTHLAALEGVRIAVTDSRAARVLCVDLLHGGVGAPQALRPVDLQV